MELNNEISVNDDLSILSKLFENYGFNLKHSVDDNVVYVFFECNGERITNNFQYKYLDKNSYYGCSITANIETIVYYSVICDTYEMSKDLKEFQRLIVDMYDDYHKLFRRASILKNIKKKRNGSK